MDELYIQVKARQDLKQIWLYSYNKYGEKQADSYYDELTIGMTGLVANPYIGVACDDICLGYRYYQINQHLVFYRLDTQKIHIVRVLHKSMKFEKHV